MKLTPFNNTFGMPPSSYVSDTAIINSMPVLNITPGIPNFESGLTLFRVDDAWNEYQAILKNHGYELPDKNIRIAFIADSFPTDTFTNEYGETFLQKFTDVASAGVQQIAQMTGSRTATGGLQKIGGELQNIGKDGGMTGAMFSEIGDLAMSTAAGLESLRGSLQGTSFGGAASLVNNLIGGHRVDFPQIWRNSGFTPSYTITVRLYNPNPGNAKDTEQYIIGPLAVILCLAIPRTQDGKTFNWPFFHKINAPGIYNLNPAVITNVTVIKGGDQQQISFNQKLGMVDVRIDFTSLYGTMVLEENPTMEQARPTIYNYLQSLKENDTSLYYTRNQMRSEAAKSAGTGTITGSAVIATSTSQSNQQLTAKNAAASRRIAPVVTEQAVGNRVSSSIVSKENNLIGESPNDFVH